MTAKHTPLTLLALAALAALVLATPASAQTTYAPNTTASPPAPPSIPTTGYYTFLYDAVVNADGTLATGPRGSSSAPVGWTPTDTTYNQAYGDYEVIFPRSVLHCTFTVTMGDTNSSGVPSFTIYDPNNTPPYVSVTGVVVPSVTHRFGNPKGVFIQLYGPIAGNDFKVSAPFHLHTLC